jgi:hypothetical protein
VDAPGPFAVQVTRWPAGPVVVDDVVADADTVHGQVWQIEGTWRSGTVEVGGRTLTEHPSAKLYHRSPNPAAGLRVKWSSPLDSTQATALERLRSEGLVVADWPVENPDGAVVYTIHTSNPPAVRDALNLRPDQPVSVEPSPWTAATVEAARAAIFEHEDEWHLYAVGVGKGVAGRPLVLTASVGWLEPESLAFYEATPPGLLEWDVWLSPAAGQ